MIAPTVCQISTFRKSRNAAYTFPATSRSTCGVATCDPTADVTILRDQNRLLMGMRDGAKHKERRRPAALAAPHTAVE